VGVIVLVVLVVRVTRRMDRIAACGNGLASSLIAP
jgi:hypothetical protein